MKSFILLLLFTAVSCAPGGGGTTTGNPVTVDMKFAAYNSSFAAKLRRLFIKDAVAGVSSFEMCFKRLRFKLESGSVGDSTDLAIGRVSIDPLGTPLGTVDVADAVYKRVEFDLENDCENAGAPSVYIVNDYGTFQTNDRMTIKFEGSFTPSQEDLIMAIQAIVDQAKTVTSDSEIKTKLEGVSGTLPSP